MCGLRCRSDGLGGGVSGGPGPLEIVAAEVARYVDDLSDEEEAGDAAGLHCFGVEFIGGNAAAGDFSFVKAFRASGNELPLVEAVAHFLDAGDGLREAFGEEPNVGEAGGEEAGEGALGFKGKDVGEVATGEEIDGEGLAGFPI